MFILAYVSLTTVNNVCSCARVEIGSRRVIIPINKQESFNKK